MNGINGDGVEQEARWDRKTQTLVASLEALLRLHREQLASPARNGDGPKEQAPEAAPPKTSP